MSDPVSNAEIEDVLSSIRRLVSEDARPLHRPEATAEPATERLVLTPALRVAEVEAETRDDVAPEDTPPEPEAAEQVNATDSTPWTDPGATLYAVAEAHGEAGTDHCGEDHPVPETTALLLTNPKVDEASDDDALQSVETDAWTQPDSEEPEQIEDDASGTNEADDGEAETWDEVEALNSAEEVEAGAADPDMANADGQPDDAHADPEEDHAPDEADEGDFTFGSARGPVDDLQPLSARIEALETVVGEAHEQWEPDDAGVDDYAGTHVETLTWEDRTDTEEPSAVFRDEQTDPIHEDQRAEALEADQDGDVLVGEEAIMDEESLRELVSDIVRQELQGALGERITRNVRKLVRREIHRALTTQELD